MWTAAGWKTKAAPRFHIPHHLIDSRTALASD